MKRLALLVMLLFPLALFAQTDETDEGIDALLDRIDLSAWDAWYREHAPDVDLLPSEYLKALAEQRTTAAGLTLDALSERLLPSLRPVLGKTMLLVGFAVIGAAIRGLSDASSVGETAQAAFLMTVCGAVLLAALRETAAALETIRTVGRTAELLLPVLVGYLTFSGMENTALLLSASHAAISETVLTLIGTVVAPCAVIGGVLHALDAGAKGRLASLGKLGMRAAKWCLGTVSALFLLVTAIRAVAAGSADGLLMKTTKFAAASLPSIGALLSESVDVAYLCLRFVKNVLGLTGCVTVLLIAAKPVLSTVLARCAFRAAALLSEPLSAKPYAELLRGLGDMLHLLFLCELAAVACALMLIAPVFGEGGV
jgi:stage III sporulation protein AE